MKTLRIGIYSIFVSLICGCASVSVSQSQKEALEKINSRNNSAQIINVGFVSYDPYRVDSNRITTPTPVNIKGKLFLPSGKGPFPAVVISVSSAGHNDQVMSGLANDLPNYGYAVLVVQSLLSRGAGAVGDNQQRVSVRGPAVDALYGLEYLRSLPIIDDDRICVVGHSRGGLVAFNFTYFKSFIEMSGFKGKPFSCNISIAGSNHYKPKNETTTKKPALVIFGEKDDVWYDQETIKWINELRYRGEKVDYIVLKNTHHSLTTDSKFCPSHHTAKGCKKHLVYDDKNIYIDGQPVTRKELTSRCTAYGYHCTYSSFNMYSETSKIIVDFLNKNIGK
jgi:dienelactone hydrolase